MPPKYMPPIYLTSKEEELLASPVFPALQNLPRQGKVGDSTLSARPAFGPCATCNVFADHIHCILYKLVR